MLSLKHQQKKYDPFSIVLYYLQLLFLYIFCFSYKAYFKEQIHLSLSSIKYKGIHGNYMVITNLKIAVSYHSDIDRILKSPFRNLNERGKLYSKFLNVFAY